VRQLLLLLLAAASLALLVAACGGGASASNRTMAVRYSQFEPGVMTVPQGVPITFTLRNDDPIEHEWIVGRPDVHERHRTGAEPFHAEIPSEVTIPAFASRETTLTFSEPGDYAFICHLPGHEDYGMVGVVKVV
jgi:uncharacterized cupredoxin-like copper-binding protein